MTENPQDASADYQEIPPPDDSVAAQYDADCAELDKLGKQNVARLQALARDGLQVDPASVINLRIDVLAEMVFGKGSADLLAYKLRVQRQLAVQLRGVEGEVRKASMAAAARATPQQVQQLAAINGLLGPDGRPLRQG